MSKFNLKHLLLILSLIVVSGISLLWFFHEYIPKPYPNSETYLLLVIYVIMLSVTAFAYKSNNFTYLHKQIGFRQFKLKYSLIAIAIGLLIWVLDYLYQTHTMNVDITIAAQEWTKNKNLTIAFATTVVFAPIIEEMLFRGIFLQTINKYLSRFWTALLVSSLFVLVHVSLIDSPPLFLAAIIYAWLTFKTNSIIPAIIAHIINNCFTYFYFTSLV